MGTDFKMSTRSAVERYSNALVDLSRSIHAEPELAFAEHRSAAKVADLLAAEGFEVERGVADLETAFTATFGSGELVLGLCAEYDALPEIGHACGHNVIAAAPPGRRSRCADLADELGLTVRVIGTPAEEGGGGKVLMLERGVFDDVAFAMMVHPAPYEAVGRAFAGHHRRRGPLHRQAVARRRRARTWANAADAITVAQVAVGLAPPAPGAGPAGHGIVTDGGERAQHRARAHASDVSTCAPTTSTRCADLEERANALLRGGRRWPPAAPTRS